MKFFCTPSKILKSTPPPFFGNVAPLRTYNFNLNIDENFFHDFRFDEIIFSYYLFFRSGDIIVPFPFRASPNLFNLPSTHRLAASTFENRRRSFPFSSERCSLFKHSRRESWIIKRESWRKKSQLPIRTALVWTKMRNFSGLRENVRQNQAGH